MIEIPKLPLWTIHEISQLYPEKSHSTIKGRLSRMSHNGHIIRLKKWVYVGADFLQYRQDQGYLYFLANMLYTPSYLSLETALDYYQIFSESSFGYACVSTSKTFDLTNPIGHFTYRSIKTELFTGSCIKRIGKYDIHIATKAKALFDYIWYRKHRFHHFSIKELQSLRLNIELLDTPDLEEFAYYVDRSYSHKMRQFYSLLTNYVVDRNY